MVIIFSDTLGGSREVTLSIRYHGPRIRSDLKQCITSGWQVLKTRGGTASFGYSCERACLRTGCSGINSQDFFSEFLTYIPSAGFSVSLATIQVHPSVS